jgi:hypothetical protein
MVTETYGNKKAIIACHGIALLVSKSFTLNLTISVGFAMVL